MSTSTLRSPAFLAVVAVVALGAAPRDAMPQLQTPPPSSSQQLQQQQQQLQQMAPARGSATVPSSQALRIRPLAERKVARLPDGELWWRIERFPAIDPARTAAAAGAWTLAVDEGGQAWLFTLGARGGSTPGGTRVAEVGPIPRIAAAEYLLRINDASGPPGSVTNVHSHPGSEAFFVLAGEQGIRSEHGTMRIAAGHGEAGQGADHAMQVSSSGSTDLHALVMFVVDASRPFSTPATLPEAPAAASAP